MLGFVVLVPFALVALLFGWLAIAAVRKVVVTNPARRGWTEVEGRIIALHVVRSTRGGAGPGGGSRRKTYPVYEYTDAAGVLRTVTDDVSDGSAVVGARRRMLLDPENPGHAVVHNPGRDTGNLVISLLALAFAVTICCVAGWFAFGVG